MAQLNPLTRSFCDITSSINNEHPRAEQREILKTAATARLPHVPPVLQATRTRRRCCAKKKKKLCPVFQHTGPAGVLFTWEDAEVTPADHPYPN